MYLHTEPTMNCTFKGLIHANIENVPNTPIRHWRNSISIATRPVMNKPF